MRQVVQAVVLSGTLAAAAVTMSGARVAAQSPAPASVTFVRDIQPILEGQCLSCHGDAMQMGKLDLRTRETALAGGVHGTVLVPGNAEQSKLYRMVAGLEKPSMPM